MAYIGETRRCKTCGAEFVSAAANQKYCCHECKDLEIKANRNEIRKIAARRRKVDSCTLNRIAREALEAGMSYGQYVAMKEMPNKIRA